MKYKIFLFAFLFVLTGHLTASSEFTGVFTQINPSATTRAFGNESGTAYIWGNNPLNSWSNPALLAYNDGLSWGWSHDPWFEDVIDGIYINSSYISYANRNIGLLIPMFNASGNLGTTCDYGMQEAYDANGHLVSKFHSYEICSRFAAGKKLLNVNFTPGKSQNSNSFSLSAGYDFRNIISKIKWTPEDTSNTAKGTMHGVGLLGHFTHDHHLSSLKSLLRIEFTSGLYLVNAFKNKMSYASGDYPLPYGSRVGFTGKVSYDFGVNSNISMPVSFLQSNVSLCFVYDKAKYGDNSSTWGQGFEFGLFDMLFLRWGEYHDEQGHIEGNTSGICIKLNFNNVVNFEYNYAMFPGGELQAEQRKNDLMVSVDLMKVFKKK